MKRIILRYLSFSIPMDNFYHHDFCQRFKKQGFKLTESENIVKNTEIVFHHKNGFCIHVKIVKADRQKLHDFVKIFCEEKNIPFEIEA